MQDNGICSATDTEDKYRLLRFLRFFGSGYVVRVDLLETPLRIRNAAIWLQDLSDASRICSMLCGTYRQFMKKPEQEETDFVEVEKEKSAAQKGNETESSETASKDCWYVLDRNVQGR